MLQAVSGWERQPKCLAHTYIDIDVLGRTDGAAPVCLRLRQRRRPYLRGSKRVLMLGLTRDVGEDFFEPRARARKHCCCGAREPTRCPPLNPQTPPDGHARRRRLYPARVPSEFAHGLELACLHLWCGPCALRRASAGRMPAAGQGSGIRPDPHSMDASTVYHMPDAGAGKGCGGCPACRTLGAAWVASCWLCKKRTG